MPDISPVAVAVATLAAFIVSSTYYALFSTKMAALRGADSVASTAPPPPSKLAAELLRSLVMATVVAAVIARGQVDTAGGVLLVAVIAWLGFPVTLLGGSVLWEDVKPRLAALHAGDWLIKLVAVAAIIGAIQ